MSAKDWLIETKKEAHGVETIKTNIIFYVLTLCSMPHALCLWFVGTRNLLNPETRDAQPDTRNGLPFTGEFSFDLLPIAANIMYGI